jgi:hypothetical protein
MAARLKLSRENFFEKLSATVLAEENGKKEPFLDKK